MLDKKLNYIYEIETEKGTWFPFEELKKARAAAKRHITRNRVKTIGGGRPYVFIYKINKTTYEKTKIDIID